MKTSITQAHVDKMNAFCGEIEKALRNGGVWNCEIFPDSDFRDVIVEIYDGDWKHEHLRAVWIIEELGGEHLGEWLLEDSDSDCYSAGHRFSFNGI